MIFFVTTLRTQQTSAERPFIAIHSTVRAVSAECRASTCSSTSFRCSVGVAGSDTIGDPIGCWNTSVSTRRELSANWKSASTLFLCASCRSSRKRETRIEVNLECFMSDGVARDDIITLRHLRLNEYCHIAVTQALQGDMNLGRTRHISLSKLETGDDRTENSESARWRRWRERRRWARW